MKKIKFIFLLLLTFSCSLIAQNRTNSSTPKIGIVNSSLLKATGWLYNPEGQWVSRNNKIPSFMSNEFKTLIDIEQNGLGIDNFISYEFRNINIKDSTYCILIKKHKDGYYKYSSLKEGWYNYNTVVFYVFKKSEMIKLKNIKNDTINLVSIDILYSNNIQFINPITYLNDISLEILRQMNENKEGDSQLILHIAPFKTKNIQFNIYSSYSKYKIITGVVNKIEYKETWDDKYKRIKEGDTSTKTYYLSNTI